jgi:hypothetical protein
MMIRREHGLLELTAGLLLMGAPLLLGLGRVPLTAGIGARSPCATASGR